MIIYAAATGPPLDNPLMTRAYTGLGFGVLLATSVGFYLAGRMAGMLRRLLKAMRGFAAGHYDKRASLHNVVIPAEILGLTDEFNRMGDQIAGALLANREQLEQIRAANAQLAQLDQFKSDLIDAVSHEFRTPLTSIKGYAATLLRKDAPFDEDTRRRLLKIIKNQADRLSRLVDDLLTIPKLDAGDLRLDLKAISVGDSLQPAMALFPDREIAVSLDPALPAIWADPDRLEQVFVNLLENATKYSPSEAAVTVTAQVVNAMIQLTIANPCEPIAPDQIEPLFTKFYRLDNRLTRTSRGTGLGLYLTRSLIEGMGGQITAAADEQFVVTFTLPFADPTPSLPP